MDKLLFQELFCCNLLMVLKDFHDDFCEDFQEAIESGLTGTLLKGED